MSRHLCVFAGASAGGAVFRRRPEPVIKPELDKGHSREADYFRSEAYQLGRSAALAGWSIVYGGGGAGLMGALADGALSVGGVVQGVIPRDMIEREWAHSGVTQMHVVETMHERKQMMHDLCDAFVALPGGVGTFEELFEVLTWLKLGIHRKPVAVLNSDGFFDRFLQLLDQLVNDGFYAADDREALLCARSVEHLLHTFG